jgi:transposase
VATVTTWVGIDIGKTHHHAAALDTTGETVLSRRVANTEPDLLKLLNEVTALGGTACWAVDLTTSPAALLLALLWHRRQPVRYVSGTVAHYQSRTWPGETKTDARDAIVIAHTLRTHRGLPQLRQPDPLIAELQVHVAHRADLTAQRIATIQRLRQVLATISPAVEKALNLCQTGPVLALTSWQTPTAILAAGPERIERLLRSCRINNASAVAEALHAAAGEQTIVMPGQHPAAARVKHLASEVIALGKQIRTLDATVDRVMAGHPLTPILTSMPGLGTQLSAELLAHTNGLTIHTSPDRLASHAGLTPASRDSGTISGNHRRRQCYHRDLRRIFYLSAFAAISCCPRSRAYYDKKRAEGKAHRQALFALARRRVDVLWALVRDETTYQSPPSASGERQDPEPALQRSTRITA